MSVQVAHRFGKVLDDSVVYDNEFCCRKRCAGGRCARLERHALTGMSMPQGLVLSVLHRLSCPRNSSTRCTTVSSLLATFRKSNTGRIMPTMQMIVPNVSTKILKASDFSFCSCTFLLDSCLSKDCSY